MYTEVEDKALFQNGTLCFESSSRRRKLYLFKYVQPLKASSYHRAGLSGIVKDEALENEAPKLRVKWYS